jgi:hypothetical protein
MSMKHYYKECKTAKQAVAFMDRYNVNVADEWYIENFIMTSKDEFDFDGWMNIEETKGSSVQILLSKEGLEIFITKYTKKDLEEMEKELWN